MGERVGRPSSWRMRGLIAIGVATLPMAVAACGSSNSSSSSSGDGSQTIKVGDLESLTGAGASVGVPQANAMKLAAKKINDAGGIKAGSKSYKIKLVTVDDKSDPTAGVTAVQKLL